MILAVRSGDGEAQLRLLLSWMVMVGGRSVSQRHRKQRHPLVCKGQGTAWSFRHLCVPVRGVLAGTSLPCPGKKGIHLLWKCSKCVWIWHLGIWFNGEHGSVGLDLVNLRIFSTLNNSVIACRKAFGGGKCEMRCLLLVVSRNAEARAGLSRMLGCIGSAPASPQLSILGRIWALNAVFADANILSGERMQQSPDTSVCPK